jgi:hypothetical protein
VRIPLSDASLLWIPCVVFVVHVLEEVPRFPAWATKHFAPMSRAWFVYSHVPLLAGIIYVCAQAQAAAPGSGWVLFAFALQWALGINVLFHVGTTIWFREYSPGLVTALLVVLPATIYLHNRVVAEGLLTDAQIRIAIAVGAVVSVAAVASLWLPTAPSTSPRSRG